jgi:hypothetical protein
MVIVMMMMMIMMLMMVMMTSNARVYILPPIIRACLRCLVGAGQVRRHRGDDFSATVHRSGTFIFINTIIIAVTTPPPTPPPHHHNHCHHLPFHHQVNIIGAFAVPSVADTRAEKLWVGLEM